MVGLLLRMNDREPEKLFERVEITIVMKQGMPVTDAMRRDQQVDGVPDRPSGLSRRSVCAKADGAEPAIVPGRVDRCPRVRHRNQLELVEDRLDRARGTLVAPALVKPCSSHILRGSRGRNRRRFMTSN